MDNDGGQLPVDRTGGMNPVKQPAGHRQLVGRDPELGHLDAFLRRAAVHGGSLLLSGPAGVGKTALLNAAVDNAATSGFVVWAAGGAELEADLPFAVLHQLLLSAAASAARPEQGALRIALGRGQGDAPPADQVAADILALLRVVAQTSPVLLVVDDLQWADSPSREVLGLIADGSGRRTGLLTATDAEPDTVAHPKLRVPPLTAAASAKLLDAHPLTMAAGVRRRVLAIRRCAGDCY